MAGEVAKTYLLGKERKNTAQIAASVMIDKITGIIGLILIGILGIFFTHHPMPIAIIMGFSISSTIGILILFFTRWTFFYYFLIRLINSCKTKVKSLKNIFGKINHLIYAWKIYAKEINVLIISILLGVVHSCLLCSYL